MAILTFLGLTILRQRIFLMASLLMQQAYATTPLTNHLQLTLDDLHPAQFNIGKRVVQRKKEKIKKLYRKGKLEKYRKKKIIPLVQGPNKTLYMLDRHHTSTAMFTAEIPIGQKFMYGKIKANLAHLNNTQFWREMERRKWVFLYDNGNKREAHEIPKVLTALTNNPYRSLASLIRNKGHYKKVKVPFLEFKWAAFFRVNGVLLHNSSNDSEWSLAIEKSIELSHSKKASHLPGYINQSPEGLAPKKSPSMVTNSIFSFSWAEKIDL